MKGLVNQGKPLGYYSEGGLDMRVPFVFPQLTNGLCAHQRRKHTEKKREKAPRPMGCDHAVVPVVPSLPRLYSVGTLGAHTHTNTHTCAQLFFFSPQAAGSVTQTMVHHMESRSLNQNATEPAQPHFSSNLFQWADKNESPLSCDCDTSWYSMVEMFYFEFVLSTSRR